MTIVQVAAVAKNGVIGRAGVLPWRLKSELAHFRSITLGKPVVMGRKTFCSIGKPLSGRTNIVVSRDPGFAAAGTVVAASIEAALAVAGGDALRRGASEIVIIGGADLYRQTLAAAQRLVITWVDLEPEGDAIFPAIDPLIWKIVDRQEHPAQPGDEAAFAVITYERNRARA
jgi:dihydrofolate reductase